MTGRTIFRDYLGTAQKLHFKFFLVLKWVITLTCIILFCAPGLQGIPARKLCTGWNRLSLCTSFWQHNDWYKWQHCNCLYGLHKRALPEGKMQIFSSSCSLAGQNQSCSTPDKPSGSGSPGSCCGCYSHGKCKGNRAPLKVGFKSLSWPLLRWIFVIG